MGTRGFFAFSVSTVMGMAVLNSSTALFAEPSEVCIYGHPVLEQTAKPIEKFDGALKVTAERLVRALHSAGDGGVGLAAPQIGLSERIAVAEVQMPTAFPPDWTEEKISEIKAKYRDLSKKIIRIDADGKRTQYEDIVQFGTFVFADPEIIFPDMSEREYDLEGCISLPGLFGFVPRRGEITLKYRDLDGNACELECDGFLARVIQHETDHLNGILFIKRICDGCLFIDGANPIWKHFSDEYKQLEAMKDDALTKKKLGVIADKRPDLSEKIKDRIFCISDANAALEIVKKIGGKNHLFNYDALRPQAK